MRIDNLNDTCFDVETHAIALQQKFGTHNTILTGAKKHAKCELLNDADWPFCDCPRVCVCVCGVVSVCIAGTQAYKRTHSQQVGTCWILFCCASNCRCFRTQPKPKIVCLCACVYWMVGWCRQRYALHTPLKS